MADTLVVTNQTDRDFVDEHEAILVKLEGLAANKRNWEAKKADAEARIVTIDAALTTTGMRIRRGLVRYKPALDGTLPATLADDAIDRSTPSQITIHWNAAAETFRNQ